jgi:hypothetical protein
VKKALLVVDTPARNTRMQSLSQSTVTRSKLAMSKVDVDHYFQQKVDKRTEMNRTASLRQQGQAEEMQKRYVANVTMVSIGNYVCIRVDRRDRRVNSNRGILAVVSFVTESKGIQAVTEEGIIAHKGRIAIVPPDTYKVLSDFSTVPSGLQRIRKEILQGKTTDWPKVSKQEAHLKDNGSWFHSKCQCKTKCGPSCGCVKNKVSCGSGCGCRVRDFECENCNNST